MTQITGSVAVVTGGASGIGRGIAEQLIAEGATVVIADIETEALTAVAAEIGATGICVDVRDSADLERLAATVLEQHGRVDILVNNAGVGPIAPIRDLTLADWRWMLDVNLYGVIHGILAFLPLLEANPEGGHILNTASMAALTPVSELGAYTASKRAVTALTEVLDLELRARNSPVRASVLLPGGVSTAISTGLRNRPDQTASSGLRDVNAQTAPAASQRWIQPSEVGQIVAQGLRSDEVYLVTHPELWPLVAGQQAILKNAFQHAGATELSAPALASTHPRRQK